MIASLLSLLDLDFSGIMRPENLAYDGNGSLVRDTAHGYHFHWVGHDISLINVDGPAIRDHQEKGAHLVDKFRDLMKSRESKVLFYATEENGARGHFEKVAELIRGKFGARNFKIVLLQPIARFEPDWGSEIVANRYLDRFAPWADATDGHVRSWDAVFKEFPHGSGLALSGFV